MRGRSKDNSKIENSFNWKPTTKLYDGLKITYKWIYDEMLSGDNSKNLQKVINFLTIS